MRWMWLTLALAADLPFDEAPKACDACADWNADHAPFPIAPGAWYVGPAGLASVVVATADGLVLVDATLPEAVGPTWDRIVSLGLDPADVRYVLVSHAHYDHAGGAAAWQRRTGALIVAGEGAEGPLRAGDAGPGDPQATSDGSMRFPPVTGPIRTLADGERLDVGGVVFERVAVPGHTPSGSTWTWPACGAAGCTQVVFADSLNPVSAEGFRYSDDPAAVAAFRASIARVADLRCDVIVPVHPSFGDLMAHAARAERRGLQALRDPRGCERYAKASAKRLRDRLRAEAAR